MFARRVPSAVSCLCMGSYQLHGPIPDVQLLACQVRLHCPVSPRRAWGARGVTRRHDARNRLLAPAAVPYSLGKTYPVCVR